MGVEWAPVPVMTTFSEKFATWSERTAALLLFQIWRRGHEITPELLFLPKECDKVALQLDLDALASLVIAEPSRAKTDD
ncbi:hypothetical protein CDAR_80761 [Caerostris darwini]|uniref:Uncharacterized protein n=1 Tax=Caerostris darwini TaxID=1538125 RepID=A0AAV4VQY5_9ARAC|nr:hypothetical protein CDAR_80761 [Caerostris darwini]